MKPYFRSILAMLAVLLLFGIAPTAAQTETVVHVYPAFQQVQPGAEFDLTIQIDDVVNLYAYDFTLSFPPDQVEVLSAAYGDFLVGQLMGFIFPDNVNGKLWAVASQQNPAEPQSGSGTLVTMHLRAKTEANGYAALVLTNVELSRQDGELISCSLQDGRVHFGGEHFRIQLGRWPIQSDVRGC